jgi:hypothetical protein
MARSPMLEGYCNSATLRHCIATQLIGIKNDSRLMVDESLYTVYAVSTFLNRSRLLFSTDITAECDSVEAGSSHCSSTKQVGG